MCFPARTLIPLRLRFDFREQRREEETEEDGMDGGCQGAELQIQ